MTHAVERIALKSSAPGTERFLTVHRFGTPGARPKAYLQAALHADEWPGLMALHHLIPKLAAADAAGQVIGEIVVLPYANPIGLDQRLGGSAPGRYAFDGSGNFNRGWPDLSDAAAAALGAPLTGDPDHDVPAMRSALLDAVAGLSTRTDVMDWEARLLALSIDADAVIDIHCDQESLAHLYCHASHADLARDMAAAIDIPVTMLEDEAGGFSFDDANAGVWRRMGGKVENGERLPMPCFGCTLELRGKDDVSDAYGAADAEGLMRFFAARGYLMPDADGLGDAPEPYRLEEVDVISSPVAGLLAYRADIGDTVAKGQPIADVIDITAEDTAAGRVTLASRTDGLFFARVDLRLIRPGERIGKVAGRVPLEHRKSGALLED